jgi:hypothetical protein
MSSRVSSQEVELPSHLPGRETTLADNGVGGGPKGEALSLASLALNTPLASGRALRATNGGELGGNGDGGVVRTRGWGRGPARRGLTLGALDLTL